MKTRVLFGVFGAIFVVLALYIFPPIVATIAMIFLSVVAAQEFTAAISGKHSGALQILAMVIALAMAIVSSPWGSSYLRYTVGFVGMVLLFCFLLRMHKKYGFKDIAGAMFAGVALPFLLMTLIRILNLSDGKIYILLPLLSAWGSDTCALFAGMAFGKHKLAPVVSPKKTIEGSVGGVLGAVLLCVLYALVVHFAFHYPIGRTVLEFAVIGLFGSVLGQIGDLSFSIVKRGSGIKDYGKIFPGHGGVLDRFDSVIFVAPAIELLIGAFAMLG